MMIVDFFQKYEKCLNRILLEAKKGQAYIDAQTIEVLDPDFVCKIVDKFSYSSEGKLLSVSTPEQFRSAIVWFYRKILKPDVSCIPFIYRETLNEYIIQWNYIELI